MRGGLSFGYEFASFFRPLVNSMNIFYKLAVYLWNNI